MERRMVLTGAAAAAAGTFAKGASAADPLPDDVAAALTRFRASIPKNFDRAYVENAVIPFFLTSFYEGERPALPYDRRHSHTKQDALPSDLSGAFHLRGMEADPSKRV